jgi:hypothetical protein
MKTLAPIHILAILLLLFLAFVWLISRRARNKQANRRIVQRAQEPVLLPTAHPASQGNIFISYASADRPTAQMLASALSGEGWSVWWDRNIPPGKSFDEVIEAALTKAKCVLVLWSKASVASNWVKTEASDAAKRNILIPVLIEDVTIPLEFRRLEAADLIGWQGSRNHTGLRTLLSSVADIVPKSGASR